MFAPKPLFAAGKEGAAATGKEGAAAAGKEGAAAAGKEGVAAIGKEGAAAAGKEGAAATGKDGAARGVLFLMLTLIPPVGAALGKLTEVFGTIRRPPFSRTTLKPGLLLDGLMLD